MEFSFNTRIAQLTHSADEAVFVHRIWYLTMNNEANGHNFFDGKYWTYDSIQALSKIFSFWTQKQLRRIIKNCVNLGLVETGRHSDNPFDRRCWYTVSDTVREIYQDGLNHLPEWANGSDGMGDCSDPNGQMYIRPNGQMIKGAIKDQLKDLREDTPAREAYGEFGNVMLSAAELQRLVGKWGEDRVWQEVEELSAYMASKGKRYKSHHATLSNWLRRKYQAQNEGRRSKLEDW